MGSPVTVGKAEDVAEGTVRPFAAGGKPVAVCRVGGVLHALDGTCPHRGGPLGEGTLADGVLTCPWHGWRFEAATGNCLNAPGKAAVRFPVREESGSIVVEV